MTIAEPLEQHIRAVRAIGLQMPAGTHYAAYERMKAEFSRQFPGATPGEYTIAMREIARACGV